MPVFNPRQGHQPLLPQPPAGLGKGAALALLAHGALLLALTQTVQWRARTPEVFSAELWAAVPQAAQPAAAPAPPLAAPGPAQPPPTVAVAPPPPPARDADIATEQARQDRARQAEEEARRMARVTAENEAAKKAAATQAEAARQAADKARADAEATRKREADAKKAEEARRKLEEAQAKAEDDRLAQQRQENLRRMMGQAGTGNPGTSVAGTSSTGVAAQGGAPSAGYAAQLRKIIRDNLVFTGEVEGNPSAEVEVRAAAGGSIISRRLIKSSGNQDYDEAVLRAIDKTATLPRDTDGRVPPAMILVFRPKDG